MPISENTVSVQAPTQSKQSAGAAAPRYSLRRVNIPGPNTGFPYVISFGPKTVTATTAGQFEFQIPGAVRPLAFGWYCLSTGGGSTVRIGRTATIGVTMNSTIVGSAIDIAGTTSGIAYRIFAALAADIQGGGVSAGRWTSGADVASITDPELPPTGSTTPRSFLTVRFPTVSTATDFCCYLLVVPTKHPNTLLASD